MHRRILHFARVARLADFIERDLERTYALEDFACSVGMNKAALCRYVREKIGMTPFDLLRSLRMARAAQMLTDGDEAIGAIARSVGYRSLPTFSRTFKVMFGVSPAAYRAATLAYDNASESLYA